MFINHVGAGAFHPLQRRPIDLESAPISRPEASKWVSAPPSVLKKTFSYLPQRWLSALQYQTEG